jgi:hypothetical protein
VDARRVGGGVAVGVDEGGVKKSGAFGEAVAAGVETLDFEALFTEAFEVLPD